MNNSASLACPSSLSVPLITLVSNSLAPSSSWRFHWLTWIGFDSVLGGDLLDRLAATDRFHGDLGLELGAVRAALTHGVEVTVQGRYLASEVNDRTYPGKPGHLSRQG